MFKVGTVLKYYEKLGMAIVDLTSDLLVGDHIKYKNIHDHEEDQVVEVMQMEHKKIDFAKAGSVVGLQLDEEATEGTEIYKS